MYSLSDALLVVGALAVELAREDVGELQLRRVQLVVVRRALRRHQLAVRLVLHQPVHEVIACGNVHIM